MAFSLIEFSSLLFVQKEKALRHEENLEKSKSIVIKMDASLPPPKTIKIRHAAGHRGTRVLIKGWVHRLRRQGGCGCRHFEFCHFDAGETDTGQALIFIVLRDGTGFLQCVLTDTMVGGDCCHVNFLHFSLFASCSVRHTMPLFLPPRALLLFMGP